MDKTRSDFPRHCLPNPPTKYLTPTKVNNLVKDFPTIAHRVAAWQEGGTDRGSPFVTSNFSTSSTKTSPRPSTEDNAAPSYAAKPQGDVSRVVERTSRPRQIAGAEADALGLGDRDRLTVASALLHGADVSSPGRRWPTCRLWVTRLMEEFHFQAEQVILQLGDRFLCYYYRANGFFFRFFCFILPCLRSLFV